MIGARPKPLLSDTNLYVVFSVTLMAILGVSSVTPAFPEIARALHTSPQSVALLIAAFTIPGIVLTPIYGVLADRVGRKAILVPTLFLFAVAGTACGLVRDFEILLALRFTQGVGGAALGALNLTIISDLYTGARRTTAMGYNAAVLSLGTGLYPAVGGALATLGWYVPFFLPILAVPVGFIVLFVLQNPEPRATGTLRDYLVNTLLIMRKREVLVLFAASVATFILVYGSFLTFLPFVLERTFGASALWIGLVMSAASAVTAVTAFHLGPLAQRFGEHRLVKVGWLLYIGAMVSIPFAKSVWSLAVPIALFGAANGINIPSILTLLTKWAPSEYRAAFLSVNGMLLRLGQTLGPVLLGAVVTFRGLDSAYFASAALAVGMFVFLAVTLVEPAEV